MNAVKKTPPRQLKAPGDCDPELPVEAIREKEIKIKNPQWITSQVVFLSQVWRQTGSTGVMRPGAMEKSFFDKNQKQNKFSKEVQSTRKKVLHKKKLFNYYMLHKKYKEKHTIISRSKPWRVPLSPEKHLITTRPPSPSRVTYKNQKKANQKKLLKSIITQRVYSNVV